LAAHLFRRIRKNESGVALEKIILQ
jgi:hypothetical protein